VSAVTDEWDKWIRKDVERAVLAAEKVSVTVRPGFISFHFKQKIKLAPVVLMWCEAHYKRVFEDLYLSPRFLAPGSVREALEARKRSISHVRKFIFEDSGEKLSHKQGLPGLSDSKAVPKSVRGSDPRIHAVRPEQIRLFAG
jgi:hypothetical protein